MENLTIKERIAQAFRENGLRKNVGEGWTPVELVVSAWRKTLKDEEGEEGEEE